MGGILIEIGDKVRVAHAAGGPLRLKTSHEGLILGALALATPGELLREAIADVLWPNSARIQAQQNLRQRLAGLRAVLGEAIQSDRTALWLDRSCFHLVLAPTGAALEACRQLAQAAAPLSGPALVSQGWPEFESGRGDLGERLRLAEALSHRPLDADQLEALIGFYAQSPELPPLRGVRYRLAVQLAQVAHAAGRWHLSLMLDREAERLAETHEEAQWSAFRQVRKRIDLGINRDLVRQLLAIRKNSQTPERLYPWVDMNLVFACAVKGELGEAEEARMRVRQHPLTRSSGDLSSWLHLNESLLACIVGKPTEGLAHLREAHDCVPPEVSPMDCYWHWYAAVHTLTALGRGAEAASLHVHADRVRAHQSAHVTPVNRLLLDQSLRTAMNLVAPIDWIRVHQRAVETRITEVPSVYDSVLRS